MKFSKFLLFSVLATILTLLVSAPGVLAAEGGNSSEPIDPDLPEVWGVVVVNCGTDSATLRVKKIEDCNVSVETDIGIIGYCPSQASDSLYAKLTGVTLFGISNTPIITKVKNWHCKQDGLCSFDAQIKFLQ